MKTKATLFFLITCLLLIPSVNAQEGKSDAGKPNTSLTALKSAAEKGDAQAQLEYAKTLNLSARVEARAWAQKAAHQGLAEAWFWLGQNSYPAEKPVQFYEKAAEKGHPEAIESLLDEVIFRAADSADIVKAKKFGDIARKLKIKLGYDSDRMLDTIDRCFEAGSHKIPDGDQPSTAEKNFFATSSLDCLSYQTGVGAPKDWAAYRKCLLSKPQGEGISVNNFLAEIYANGWGVKRNPKLALALVCHGAKVPAELEGMVDELVKNKNQAELKSEFKFCDLITSGMNGGFCAERAEALATMRRNADAEKLISKWSDPQKKAFMALRVIADEFFMEHCNAEMSRSGTAAGQMSLDELRSLRNEFIAAVQSFDEGKIPADADFKAADKDLNSLYSKIMKNKEIEETGTVTRASIRVTQLKWIKYRDEWVKFASVKYPAVKADVWKTWLTRKRIEQIKDFAPGN